MRSPLATLTLSLLTCLSLACSDDGGADDSRGSSESSSGDGDGDGDGSESESDSQTGDGDGDEPQGCQSDPELCQGDLVCDVITGECSVADLPCVLAGPSVACGDVQCGPGSVCDDQGACIPVAPCGNVTCEGEYCWGETCICDHPDACSPASAEDLNGPFATDIFDLEFADDCNAWMVTLRSGTDYVRRLTPQGELTEWAGVANLNMGEVAVLKALIPQAPPVSPPFEDELDQPPSPPDQNKNLGEVAITYTCCPTCGCFVDPPQGVARLQEGEMVPLPIVLPGVPTQGQNGPFFSTAADAGPMGLTWGDDLRLYVGNSEQDGNYDTADLEQQSQELLTTFGARVTASAPLTSVHLLVALDTGELLRFNVATNEATSVLQLETGVTALSHDAFSGLVYASLSDLSVISIDPFAAETAPFETMPDKGRVSISPDGRLWWVPARFTVGPQQIFAWDLPDTW